MTEVPDLTALWAAMTVIIMLFLGGLAADARRFRSRQKEQQLLTANENLRIHYAALAKLDSPDTPSELLALALRISDIAHDPIYVAAVELQLSQDPQAFAYLESEIGNRDTAARSALIEVSKRRPDLARAFIVACLSAVTSFVARWPHCAPAFNSLLYAVAVSPVEESEKIIRLADRTRPKNHDTMLGGPTPDFTYSKVV